MFLPIKKIRTKEFSRLRIGISPTTPSGKIKKPYGDEKVHNHVLGKFTPKERQKVSKVVKRAIKILEIVVKENYLSASNKMGGVK